MYLKIIEQLNSLQEKRLSSINFIKDRLEFVSGPKTKQQGLYWIYSTYTDKDFLKAVKSPKKGSVDFKVLVERHHQLNNVCSECVNGFRLVYNGMGGVGPKGSGGLRERILEEFRGGEGTGSLAIKGSSLNDFSKWRVSYVLWSEIKFGTPHTYEKLSEILERLWRIHYGWPVLCTK